MSEEDMKINSRVRKVLVERNLNLSLLDVSTRSGSVSVRGEAQKISGHKISENQIARLLRHIEETILRIKGVKRVTFSIHGWGKRRGKWERLDE